MKNKQIIGQKVGTVSVDVYEENETGIPIFYAQAENKHMSYVLDAIEDALNNINLD